mgnify:CR=1 FL=1
MRSLMVAIAISFMILSGLSGCDVGGNDPERYVLTGNDKNLFFQQQIVIDPRKVDEIGSVVNFFSRRHGMDFLSARSSLPPGDFNFSANGPTLNIKVMHNASMRDNGVQIFAIVPKEPTVKDKGMVRELINELKSIK